MKGVRRMIAGMITIFGLNACTANFGGNGIEIVPYPSGQQLRNCQQYASESYCERQMWGGHP